MHDSLGEFVEDALEINEAVVVEGASRDEDLGCLTELGAERGGPMLVFDSIEGYKTGWRVCTNPLRTPRRFALAVGLPLDDPPLTLLKKWRTRMANLDPATARVRSVDGGPVLANALSGADVDVELFPTPRWHEWDGGRYIGTGDLVVMRDPESGWVNVGVYRAMIQGRDKVSLWIVNSHHGRMILDRYWERGEHAPVAIVLGCDPVTWMAGALAAPWGESEFAYAGALREAPLDVVTLPESGLPVPAHAEAVLEGSIPPLDVESAYEGPFGEWPGYYSHEGHEPVVNISTIYHRHNPILLGTPPLRPLGDSDSVAIPSFTGELWAHLERSGVTDVQGVWGFGKTLLIVIAIHQKYAGHAKQALLAAAGFRAGSSVYRYFVAVDEDIDPTNLEEVLWAMSTRSDPATSVDVVRGTSTSPLDPRVPPDRRERGDYTIGRMLIDACRPFDWKENFARSNVFSPEARERVTQKWESLLGRMPPKRS
jgi:UbiD family decarboxylase